MSNPRLATYTLKNTIEYTGFRSALAANAGSVQYEVLSYHHKEVFAVATLYYNIRGGLTPKGPLLVPSACLFLKTEAAQEVAGPPRYLDVPGPWRRAEENAPRPLRHSLPNATSQSNHT